MSELSKSVKHVTESIKKDPGLREGYKANIAVQFQDAAYWYKKKNNKKYLSRADLHTI